MSKFLQGTVILIVAGFVTKILGFINRIVVARMIGDEGVGLYMMAVPTLVLAITATQIGLPVAISKLVAEAEAAGDRQRVKQILVVSLATTGVLSIVLLPALIAAAPWLSRTMFTDPRTYYPLLAIAPIVPIVAISSVLRGYFQGRQQMKPYAYSLLLEQIVRISLIALCTQPLLPYGVEYAAAGAMASSVLGELAALLYLLFLFKVKKSIRLRTKFFHYVQAGKETFVRLMRIALPTTGGRLIGSLSWFFEPIVVANSLALAGIAASTATRQYGQLVGYALPLLTLPSFITYALSTALVPAISEAMAQRKPLLVEYRIAQAMRLSLVTGGLSTVVLYLFAEPLMRWMYGTSEAAIFIQVMAPFFLLYYFQGPLQAVLQGLDLANAAMMNSLIGAMVKLVCIFVLASRPSLGIMGAALATAVSTVLVTLLHFATVIKAVSFSIDAREYIKALGAIIAAGAIGYALSRHPLLAVPTPFWTLLAMAATAALYAACLVLFRLIRREELVYLPGLHWLAGKNKRK
ncbi:MULTISPECIES: stage V sporulation protein B [Geobacillus]|uniref:Stage V sporulation protein B n=1 Tax=Geobacillus thermocatenulatus TaxID=33938 RepID=A0A226QDN3_9BACL|nr:MULTISPECIES: stage V sporulation protein B [Geobacillus]ASS98727.1 stage V sporulation protein B [Geobacillus thermocatenulatus]KLR73899.1 stage V sporulation protein B [Geobacillus sp. T6]OXB89479.1 stage V sporulation protein B [Geobacillus thermocatenulatus]RAN22674.1 stage V sporulation protein B [Geobacillus sp. A8]